jgi:hypothetical protein
MPKSAIGRRWDVMAADCDGLCAYFNICIMNGNKWCQGESSKIKYEFPCTKIGHMFVFRPLGKNEKNRNVKRHKLLQKYVQIYLCLCIFLRTGLRPFQYLSPRGIRTSVTVVLSHYITPCKKHTRFYLTKNKIATKYFCTMTISATATASPRLWKIPLQP